MCTLVQVVESLYKMGASSGMDWDTGQLGIGVVTKCVRGSFVGVWASEFTLDSVFRLKIKNEAECFGSGVRWDGIWHSSRKICTAQFLLPVRIQLVSQEASSFLVD